MGERRFFTSESVTEGHPDKICDAISDAVLDACLAQDPMSRVACETAVTTGLVLIMGEITTNANIDFQTIARDAIREAIVNAVCHRDYTSNACVQVMLFRDRLEIINPGPLPRGITVEDLYRTHDSIPRNSLIARAMSWTSYVEKSGSGTGEILDKCVEYGLARPEFDPTTGFFKTIIWRASSGARILVPSQGQVEGSSRVGPKKRAQEAGPRSGESRHPVGTQSRHSVEGASQGLVEGASQGLVKVLHVLANSEIPLSSTAIAKAFGKERANSYIKRLVASLVDDGLAETTGERKRGARLQKYRLTAKGRNLAAPLAKNTAKPKVKRGAK